MPRRKSTGVVATSAPASSKRKRQSATELPSTIASPAVRSSKRTRTIAASSLASRQTSKKSKYFEHSEEEVDDGSDDAESEAGGSESESGYEDEDLSVAESQSSASEEEDDYDSEEDKKKSKRGQKAKVKTDTAERTIDGKNDLWREGVKTGLGPGKQVFIEKPKARGDGGISYVPERIHPHTFEFLKDLKKNNDRIWFKAHDADYRTSWKDFESFVESLTEKIAEVDETIPELPPKDLVFRIYRDIRFSSDPTPYKPHFSAAWSRTGRKGPYACYYVQIKPGGCFVGSGLWHPEAEPVKQLRTDIDQRSSRIRGVLTDPGIRKHIFGGIGKDENKAIKAFCKQNEENALKTKPKGYEADNKNIALLRLRNFTIGQKVSDEEVLSPSGLDRIIELIRVMHPFVTYLNSVVMPDEEAPDNEDQDESSSSSGEQSSD